MVGGPKVRNKNLRFRTHSRDLGAIPPRTSRIFFMFIKSPKFMIWTILLPHSHNATKLHYLQYFHYVSWHQNRHKIDNFRYPMCDVRCLDATMPQQKSTKIHPKSTEIQQNPLKIYKNPLKSIKNWKLKFHMMMPPERKDSEECFAPWILFENHRFSGKMLFFWSRNDFWLIWNHSQKTSNLRKSSKFLWPAVGLGVQAGQEPRWPGSIWESSRNLLQMQSLNLRC